MNFPLTKRDYVTRCGDTAHVLATAHGRAIGYVDLKDQEEDEPSFVTMDWNPDTGAVYDELGSLDLDIVAEMEGGAE